MGEINVQLFIENWLRIVSRVYIVHAARRGFVYTRFIIRIYTYNVAYVPLVLYGGSLFARHEAFFLPFYAFFSRLYFFSSSLYTVEEVCTQYHPPHPSSSERNKLKRIYTA